MSTPNGAVSPSGDRHPGDIVHHDKVAARQWTDRAEDVPRFIAWVRVGDNWRPVVRIEITGSESRREFSKFGPDGEFLETTVQSVRPAPRPDPDD
jgi:hypothetical protein